MQAALEDRFELSDLKITTTGLGVRIQFKEDPVFVLAREQVAQAESELTQNPQNAQKIALDVLESLRGRGSNFPETQNLSAAQTVSLARETLTQAEDEFSKRLQSVILSTLNLSAENARFSQRSVGSALGSAFWQNAVNVVLIGIVLVGLVIFYFFREFYPTLGIMIAVVIDILVALAGMALLEIPLSLTTLPALMMLIGYAVDTEILLSVNLFKRKTGGTGAERTWQSFKTGITMTGTTMGVLLVMAVFSYFTQITVVYEISAVLLFGLLGDVVTSWLLNAPLLLRHAEQKHGGVSA